MAAGTLRIGNNSALGTGTLTIASASTLSSASTTAYTLSNAVILSGSATFGNTTNTGVLTLGGPVTLSGGPRFVSLASATAISGVIGDGGNASGLTKLGSGSLTLSGTNTYTGETKISAGTLQLATTGSLKSGTVTVSSGGTWGLSTAGYTLSSGKTLQGGGRVTGNLTMASGSTLTLENNAALASTVFSGNLSLSGTVRLRLGATLGSDLLKVSGALTLGAPLTLKLLDFGSVTVGTYNVMTYGGALSLGAVTLDSSALGSGFTATLDTSTTPGTVSVVLALSAQQGLFTWGDTSAGAIGLTAGTARATPSSLSVTGRTVAQLAIGGAHSLILSSDGTVHTIGANTYGQLGVGGSLSSGTSTAVGVGGVLSGRNVVAVAAGATHSVAVTEDGKVYTWGDTSNGRLGIGVVTGTLRSLSVAGTGRLYTNGAATLAVSGGGGIGATATGTFLGGTLNAVSVLNGGSGYTSSPTVSVTGPGGSGATVGVTVGTLQSTPVQVISTVALAGKKVVNVVAGGGSSGGHTLALDSNGLVYSWGKGTSGQLGAGSAVDQASPVAIPTTSWGTKKITMLAAGENHSLAVDEAGVLHAWGDNTYGQFGDGTVTTTGRSSPKALNGVVAITVTTGGSGYTTAPGVIISGGGGSGATATTTVVSGVVTAVNVTNSGSGYTSTPTVTITGVGTGATATAVRNTLPAMVTVAAGGRHSLAVDTNGVVWACGDNTSGQLGVDPLVSGGLKFPVVMDSALFGGAKIIAVAAGSSHSMAVTELGGVYTWGGDGSEQLGNGAATASHIPVRLVNGTATGAVASGNRSAYLNGVCILTQPVTTQVAAGTATLTSVARLSGDAFGIWSKPQSAGGRITYDWYAGTAGAEVLDGTNTTSNATFTVTSGMAHLSVYLKATALQTDRSTNSNVVGVWELGSIGDAAIVTRPMGVVIASGSLTNLSVTTNAISPTFSWSSNGSAVSPTLTYSGARLVGSSLQNVGEGTYSVTVNTGSVATTETITVGVRSWSSLAGTYQALLQNTALPGGLTVDSASPTDLRYPGRVTVILTSTGSFSGRLEYEGATYSLAGSFDGTTLNSVAAIGRGSGASSVNLELMFSQTDLANLTMTANTTELLPASGVVGVKWLEQSTASPLILSGSGTLLKSTLSATGVNATGQTNPQFAVLLQDLSSSGTLCSTGYMTIRVTSGGVVTSVARTGDGRILATGSLLSGYSADASMATTSCAYVGSTGTVPMYSGLYGAAYPARGHLAGTLKLDWTAANAVDLASAGSELEWKKPQPSPSAPLSGLCTKLTPVGSRYDSMVTPLTVFGALSGRTISAYKTPGQVLVSGTPDFGLKVVTITSTWTVDTSNTSFATGNQIGSGTANLTQSTMSTVTGTPLVNINLYDTNGARLFQSVGVIMQTPSGLESGVYGLIPFIQVIGGVAQPLQYTEWSLR